MRSKVLVVLLLIQGMLMVALAARRGEVACLMLPFLSYLAAGLLRAPAPDRIALQAERRVERTGAGEAGSVQVAIAVRNQGQRPIHLQLRDRCPGAARITEGCSSLQTALGPGEESELRYGFRASRGQFTWATVEAVVSDPLGLFEERLELPAAGEIRVCPELERFRPLPLRVSRTLPSPGPIPARAAGSGTDFWGVREYRPGDPLRRLDWRPAARHPGRLFTKEFEQERLADVGLILDGRPSAKQRIGEVSLFERNVAATASLAEVFLRQGHRVSVLVLGEGHEQVFPGFGRVQLQRILSCLARAGAESADPPVNLERAFSRLLPARSLIVVLGPIGSSDTPMLLRLRSGGRQVVAVSPDPIALQAARARRDPLGRLALRAARLERRLTLSAIARLRIAVVDWELGQPLDPLVRAALRPARGQQAGRGEAGR